MLVYTAKTEKRLITFFCLLCVAVVCGCSTPTDLYSTYTHVQNITTRGSSIFSTDVRYSIEMGVHLHVSV